MNFRQLQYLTTVAKYRNITRAAEALFISQPALSHYIQSAEDELGVQLFDRSTTPLTLTYAGECYIRSAQNIIQENEKLLKELKDITRNESGHIHIGVSRDRGSYIMPRLMTGFKAKYPGIDITIHNGSAQKLKEMLRDGDIDLLFLPEEEDAGSGLAHRTLYREEMLLVARDGAVPLSMRIPGTHSVDPKSLDKQPMFMMPAEHSTRVFCDDFCRKNHIKPEIIMELPSSVSCFRMATAGLGFAIVPYMITKLANPSEKPEYFSLGEPPLLREIRVYYRKDAYLSKPEQDMIVLAEEVFSHEALFPDQLL